MMGALSFASPWLLLGLLALPVLWFLLRIHPPAPVIRRFPGVVLLAGLEDKDRQVEKTPFWVFLIRFLALGGVIVAFAGPALFSQQTGPSGDRPLLVVMDGGWADARDWPVRLAQAQAQIAKAGREGRTVALLRLTDPPAALQFLAADAVLPQLRALQPLPYAPYDGALWAKKLPDTGFDSYWLSDGLAYSGRDALLPALQQRGRVQVWEGLSPLVILRPAVFEGGQIKLSALRLKADAPLQFTLAARGLDLTGTDRVLAQTDLSFSAGSSEAQAMFDLPPELRNRLTRFELMGTSYLGGLVLTDDQMKRRKVGLFAAKGQDEGLLLLSPLHYLRRAMQPIADMNEGAIADLLAAKPDVLVLADVAHLSPVESAMVQKWVNEGGVLLRFAGPKLAAMDNSQTEDDPLMPVRLRMGGRSLGEAMSWGEPKTLGAFDQSSPFFGLDIPDDVTVSRQILAEPLPDLADRTIAALADGTPLVTRSRLGKGQVVLFHITANAEWSTLPVSGLFLQMLERLSIVSRLDAAGPSDLRGVQLVPDMVLDGFGLAQKPVGLSAVAGDDVLHSDIGPAIRVGMYQAGDRRVAVNLGRADTVLIPATWPEGMVVEAESASAEVPLKAPILIFSLMLLLLDLMVTLWLLGRLRGGLAALVLAVMAAGMGDKAQAQSVTPDDFAIMATSEVRLAHILTGDSQVDDMARAGLEGLSWQLAARTTIEPAGPMGVNIERDELAFFPFLYWPITEDQPLPSLAAYQKLNNYLRNGGMILFDTRDGGMNGPVSPQTERLRLITSALDIPPLSEIPDDHVLTRSFYLLKTFPGRENAPLWGEAAIDAGDGPEENMPFRQLNDGVTPVLIGGNDWAAAWATDENGRPLYPMRGEFGGDDRREMAYRFGINLMMYVYTGNYKSDQVHVPALLERLGE